MLQQTFISLTFWHRVIPHAQKETRVIPVTHYKTIHIQI